MPVGTQRSRDARRVLRAQLPGAARRGLLVSLSIPSGEHDWGATMHPTRPPRGRPWRVSESVIFHLNLVVTS